MTKRKTRKRTRVEAATLKKPKNHPPAVFPRGIVYKETRPKYSAPTIRHGSQTYFKRLRVN